METSRRKFLKQGLTGTLLLSTATLPAPLQAMVVETAMKKSYQAKRVLLIALDGICTAGFEQAKTPTLDTLLRQGVLSMGTRVVMPSVTLPNWTSHLTGSGPEQHGVTDNNWTLDKHKLPSVVKDKDGYYPSVFTVLKENKPQAKTAFYYNWKPLVYPYNRRYLDEVSFLENDAYVENYEKAFHFMAANRNTPTLVFLYTVHTDHAGHKYKWMSPEYISSIEEADREIGKLLNRMKAENLYDDTHFMFLTDHGGIEHGHGGLSTDEMIVPWGIVGPEIEKGIQMEEPNNTVNTATVILQLFGIDKPLSWIGEAPKSIFK